MTCGGLADEQGLRGVDDVVGGESVVEPAGMRADDFGDGGGEGDDVVADLGFDLVDALDAEVGALADGVGGVFGDEAGFGEGLGGGDFDGEPGAEAVFVAPDAGHLGAGVARDHGGVLLWVRRNCGLEDSKWMGGKSASGRVASRTSGNKPKPLRTARKKTSPLRSLRCTKETPGGIRLS